MKVSATLKAITEPYGDTPANNAEELVAYCARVSSSKPEEDRGKNAGGLLKYCIRNKHWSIFEMVNAVVEVNAPRDITRQLLRHRSFSFQEFSQRYSDDIEFTEREVRLQDKKNRQNSIDKAPEWYKEGFRDDVKAAIDFAKEVYGWANKEDPDGKCGAAKECARVFLPEGLTMSTLYVNGTLRSWLHYLDVRDDPGVTQHEHVLLAREIRKALEPAFPNIMRLHNE